MPPQHHHLQQQQQPQPQIKRPFTRWETKWRHLLRKQQQRSSLENKENNQDFTMRSNPKRMSLLIDCVADTSPNNANGVLTHLGHGYNADSLVTLQNQMVSVGDFMKQAAKAPCKVQLVWGDSQTMLMVQLKSKSKATRNLMKGMDTTVDPTWFEQGPYERLGVSGGTAPFFKLHLTPEGIQMASLGKRQQLNTSYFIGKDLSHAEDEREFYEQLLRIQMQGSEQTGVALLRPFFFDYLGVLEDPSNQRKLLVLENLRNNYKHFRMLDLKMGHQTAQGGWQGKPHFNAWKQTILDNLTNSSNEGYRLEGFDGCPKQQRIACLDPMMDVLVKAYKSRMSFFGRDMTDAQAKRATRILLQSLAGADIFRYFMDLHMEQQPKDICPKDKLLSVEVQEIVLHELISQLVSLAMACHKMQVPQKWIGSSVALGYDAGLFPSRNDLLEDAEETIRDKVVVKVFDWGRSELLTEQRYSQLSKTEQADRQKFWDNYVQGIDNLAYNAARSYYNHFTNANQWTELTLQVMNFDTLTEIGHVTLPLTATPTPGQVLHSGQCHLENYAETSCGTLRCSVSWLELPNDSRLKGTWRVAITKADNLLNNILPSVPVDFKPSTVDAFCQITARDSTGRELLQSTKVCDNCALNPEWNETLDIPVARDPNQLALALREQGMGMINEDLAELFPTESGPDSTEWSQRLQNAANH